MHAIKACQNLGWKLDKICCIYPAVPLIQIDDLIGAFEILISSKANYSFPISEYSSPIQRALKCLDGLKVQPFFPEFELTRTQDLEPAYYDAGQFYWGKIDAWLTNSNIHANGIGYKIPNWRVVDIDNADDWKRAELIYQSIIKEISINESGK